MNAIILAGGVGHRLSCFRVSQNKALLMIGKYQVIERMIIHLKKAGINEIYIVCGYKAKAFEPLQKAYGVQIIKHRSYMRGGTISALKTCKHLIEDTFIIHGDVVLLKNVFDGKKESHIYTSIKENDGSDIYQIKINQHKQLIGYELVKKQGLVFSGIAYLNPHDAIVFKELLDNRKIKLKNKEWWELLPLLKPKVIQLDRKYICDIDTFDDYQRAVMICGNK